MAAKTYKWTNGSRIKVKAPVAGRELERIRSEHGGALVPKTVVEEAKPKDAPLHPAFEWRDAKAAQLYREDQARGMIHSLRVVEVKDGAERESIAFVHVHEPEHGPCYVTTAHMLSDEQMRAQVLREALALLNGMRRRFEHLNELQGVFKAVDRVSKKLVKVIEEKADGKHATVKAAGGG